MHVVTTQGSCASDKGEFLPLRRRLKTFANECAWDALSVAILGTSQAPTNPERYQPNPEKFKVAQQRLKSDFQSLPPK